jgi:hypothetical protein
VKLWDEVEVAIGVAALLVFGALAMGWLAP